MVEVGRPVHLRHFVSGMYLAVSPRGKGKNGGKGMHLVLNPDRSRRSYFVFRTLERRLHKKQGPSRRNPFRVSVCAARSLKRHRPTPGLSIAAGREVKNSLWATAGGKGA